MKKYESFISWEIYPNMFISHGGRICRVLNENGMTHVIDVIRHERDYFKTLPGFGARSLKHLDEFMETYDLHYGSKKKDYIVRKQYYMTDDERWVDYRLEVFGKEDCLKHTHITEEDIQRNKEIHSYLNNEGIYGYRHLMAGRKKNK